MVIAPLMMFFAVLVPTKMWYAPTQPLSVEIRSGQPITLTMTDFGGRLTEPSGTPDVESDTTVDLRTIFPTLKIPGTYVLYAVPQGGNLEDFLGTPLVISVRQLRHRAAPPGPMVIKIEPLRYAVMHTDKGTMKMIFYYDSAPHTSANFLQLAEQGFYDGLTFHRVIEGFVIQAGDPLGNGIGDAGYQIDAEFNSRPHLPGVLSMARSGDPRESPGIMPRSDFANSAGSQFFICLDYENTKQLDNRYTAFGRVVEGMETVQAIASVPVTGDRPQQPPVIEHVEIRSVTADDNPYGEILGLTIPSATKPVEDPATQTSAPQTATE